LINYVLIPANAAAKGAPAIDCRFALLLGFSLTGLTPSDHPQRQFQTRQASSPEQKVFNFQALHARECGRYFLAGGSNYQ